MGTQGIRSQRRAQSHLHFPEKETEAHRGPQKISSRARIKATESGSRSGLSVTGEQPESPPSEAAHCFLCQSTADSDRPQSKSLLSNTRVGSILHKGREWRGDRVSIFEVKINPGTKT